MSKRHSSPALSNIPSHWNVLRLIDVFRDLGFYVGSVVITQYAGQCGGRHAFISRLVLNMKLQALITRRLPLDVAPSAVRRRRDDKPSRRPTFPDHYAAPAGAARCMPDVASCHGNKARASDKLRRSADVVTWIPAAEAPSKSGVQAGHHSTWNDVVMIDPFRIWRPTARPR